MTVEHPDETKEAANENAKAKRDINKQLETMNLQDGERVRINGFVLTGKARHGGDFEIPAWEKVGIGNIEVAD